MNNTIEYKGYHTNVEYSADDNILFGKIEGINDLVTFECESVSEVEAAFQEAVDDYLAFCEDVGKEPDKEYKGIFNVRITPQMHRKAALEASKQGITLNAFISYAIRDRLEGRSTKETVMMVPLESMTKIYEMAATQTYNGRVEYGN